MKVYGVELSEYEAQDVCKLFKSKEDAEYFAKVTQQILKIDEIFMECWGRIDYNNEKLRTELSAGIGQGIEDIADIWGISTFYDTVRIREYEIQ